MLVLENRQKWPAKELITLRREAHSHASPLNRAPSGTYLEGVFTGYVRPGYRRLPKRTAALEKPTVTGASEFT